MDPIMNGEDAGGISLINGLGRKYNFSNLNVLIGLIWVSEGAEYNGINLI